jgi:hypothetical protein
LLRSHRSKHKFIDEEAVASMEDADRRKAHHDATKVLLEILRQDSTRTELLASVAHHFSGAGMLEEAREYSMRAAQEALKSGDLDGARSLLKEVMGHLGSLGPNKKQPGNEYVVLLPSPSTITHTSPLRSFCSLRHETLFCFVNLGRLKEAEELVRADQGSALAKCIPRGFELSRRKGKLKVGAPVHPSVKPVTSSEAAYLELQGRMWAAILEQKKGEISDFELFELTLQQLDAGVTRGKSESFLVSLVAVARCVRERAERVKRGSSALVCSL